MTTSYDDIQKLYQKYQASIEYDSDEELQDYFDRPENSYESYNVTANFDDYQEIQTETSESTESTESTESAKPEFIAEILPGSLESILFAEMQRLKPAEPAKTQVKEPEQSKPVKIQIKPAEPAKTQVKEPEQAKPTKIPINPRESPEIAKLQGNYTPFKPAKSNLPVRQIREVGQDRFDISSFEPDVTNFYSVPNSDKFLNIFSYISLIGLNYDSLKRVIIAIEMCSRKCGLKNPFDRVIILKSIKSFFKIKRTGGQSEEEIDDFMTWVSSCPDVDIGIFTIYFYLEINNTLEDIMKVIPVKEYILTKRLYSEISFNDEYIKFNGAELGYCRDDIMKFIYETVIYIDDPAKSGNFYITNNTVDPLTGERIHSITKVKSTAFKKKTKLVKIVNTDKNNGQPNHKGKIPVISLYDIIIQNLDKISFSSASYVPISAVDQSVRHRFTDNGQLNLFIDWPIRYNKNLKAELPESIKSAIQSELGDRTEAFLSWLSKIIKNPTNRFNDKIFDCGELMCEKTRSICRQLFGQLNFTEDDGQSKFHLMAAIADIDIAKKLSKQKNYCYFLVAPFSDFSQFDKNDIIATFNYLAKYCDETPVTSVTPVTPEPSVPVIQKTETPETPAPKSDPVTKIISPEYKMAIKLFKDVADQTGCIFKYNSNNNLVKPEPGDDPKTFIICGTPTMISNVYNEIADENNLALSTNRNIGKFIENIKFQSKRNGSLKDHPSIKNSRIYIISRTELGKNIAAYLR